MAHRLYGILMGRSFCLRAGVGDWLALNGRLPNKEKLWVAGAAGLR
jgi:hypothetical protein